MIKITCPNCAASMEVDDKREFAFCTYCGTKIIIENKVELNRNTEIKNLLDRAYEYEEKKDYIRARDYCNRVLDIDSKNEYARDLEKRLDEKNPRNNIIIKYQSTLGEKYKLRITTDGKTWITMNPNDQIELMLPVGKHRILFSGRKAYNKEIIVNDTKKIIEITYTAQSIFRNDITINQI